MTNFLTILGINNLNVLRIKRQKHSPNPHLFNIIC